MIIIDLVDEDINLSEKPSHRRSENKHDAHTIRQRSRNLLAYLSPVVMLRLVYAALVGKEPDADIAD